MKFTPAIRTLVALMLCLLLPLQAGATLARATAMARHGGVHAPMAAPPAAQAAAHNAHDAHHAHVGHHGSDHPHAGHKGHGDTPAPAPHQGDQGDQGNQGRQVQPADGKASHKTVHAKAGCVDCAKCCLQAAAAPPSALAPSFAPGMSRVAFVSQRAPAPAFLTGGPDRPPRPLPA